MRKVLFGYEVVKVTDKKYVQRSVKVCTVVNCKNNR